MKIKSGFIVRKIADQHMAVPVGERSQELHGMIGLNETGAFLWELLEEDQTEESLADLTFAVEAGSAGQAAAEEAGLNFITVNAQADAVMEVAAGTSDACVIDMLMAIAMLGEGTDYADLTYTVTLTDEEYGIGCRQGSDLVDAINDAMKQLYDDGTMMEIAEKYNLQDMIIAQ